MATGEGPHAGLSLPGELHAENAEALIPMISARFIDAKVRLPSMIVGFRKTNKMTVFCNSKVMVPLFILKHVFSFVPGWI